MNNQEYSRYTEWRQHPRWYCRKTTYLPSGELRIEVVADNGIPLLVLELDKPPDWSLENRDGSVEYYTYHEYFEEANAVPHVNHLLCLLPRSFVILFAAENRICTRSGGRFSQSLGAKRQQRNALSLSPRYHSIVVVRLLSSLPSPLLSSVVPEQLHSFDAGFHVFRQKLFYRATIQLCDDRKPVSSWLC